MSAYHLLEQCEEWGSVGDHSLDILPFVLQAEGEPGVRRLGVPLSNNAKGLHRRKPILHQLCQSQRKEQLRKLGKLLCHYLDQFNQKESSYAASNGCKTALQSEPRRGGSLLPGFVFLGYVQVTWVTLSICIIHTK